MPAEEERQNWRGAARKESVHKRRAGHALLSHLRKLFFFSLPVPARPQTKKMRLALLAVAAALAASVQGADPPAKAKAAAVAGRAPVAASLLGGGWSLVNSNGSISLDDVTMPTHALAALEDAKVIGDPLYR